ncbi:MAG: methylmalonyl-CoA mutase, partial [Acidobacteria bacterium]|nr:methylmalonyl-CoA mutase [Acidobacteriota bacterium]
RLDEVSTSMTINATAAILLALYVAVGKRQGAQLRRLAGTVQNDILKEYVARGTYIYPAAASMRLVTDLFAWTSRELPEWNPISVSGYHFREAGATAVQEVGFTLANAITYIQGALDAGLELDTFAPRLSFFFNAHSNFLEEIAKFRAARRLYAQIMRSRFGAKNPKSWMLRFHVQTAVSTLTAQQPDVNVVRTAIEALAAVLGGCQSLHTNARDEALALPTEESARLALRTQQVIAYESGVANTVDPAGGAYELERRTDQIEAEAAELIARIDALGGMVRAIEQGYVQREIQNASYQYQKQVESGERVVVGVNRYQAAQQAPIPILRIDPALEEEQVRRVKELRARRDREKAERALDELERVAGTKENLLPAILEAVESYATLGEISDRLRRAFGEYREAVVW